MLNFTAIAFDLSRNSVDPLFVQLSDQIRHRISTGVIEPGSTLPPSRGFSVELGVSRSTVVAAYEQLVAEGYIEGRRGSGFLVRELGETDYPLRQAKTTLPKLEKFEPSDRVALAHPGYPDSRLFPYRQWARALARCARMNPQAMIIGESPFGDSALRQSIANYLSDWRGLDVLPEQVMITAGSVDALETCIRTLCLPGEIVGLENPGYRPLHNITVNQGMRIKWLEVGADGTEIPARSENGNLPRMVVLTPSQQFPLGGAMPAYRRLEYQQWADAAGAWIIEDDYDSEFRYSGRPIPALASMDKSERTLYIGTFSKVFSVSLRLGYLIMPVPLIDRFAQTLSKFGVKAALPCQRALSDFIDGGDIYRHIRRVRRIYADRRRLLLDLVQQKLDKFVQLDDHQAGTQVTVKLAPNYDDQAVCKQAGDKAVLVSPLSSYYGGGNPQNGLLLGFCPFNEQEIAANIEILAQILESSARSIEL